MTIDQLETHVKEKIEFIDALLGEDHSPQDANNVEEIVDYGMQLSSVISLCGKTLSEAQELLKKRELIFMNANQQIWDKPTILKKLMEGQLAEYYKLVLWADRLNAACTHKMDFYRSVISKHKEELRAQVQFNNKNN